jgi:photosystem II stability/assembly factor-like uncharacterized protein
MDVSGTSRSRCASRVRCRRSVSCAAVAIACSGGVVPYSAVAQSAGGGIPETAYAALRWRLVGPFRGGRALAIEGIPGDPSTFYFGAVAGGVWRTRDAGITWQSLTDSVPFASVGALAIAPSFPNIIYVGSGEADMRSDITYGQGMWKSADGGAHWQSIGLRDTRQIGRILVDPHDPNLVLVAALGHAYGGNPDRGVYRSTDGGQTWSKVLYRDEHTGAIDLAFDPTNPRVVYAALWQAQRTPWSQYPPDEGPGSGVYKSTDEGLTWKEITHNGLPGGQLGRIGLAVARATGGSVVYALCPEARHGAGLYRSDDAGETWHFTGNDKRIGRGWYFGQVFVDPNNVDVLYVPGQSILESTDGGHTFTAIKGAPGGDDYHYIWIDPTDSRRIAFASDQGVGISLDGGQTWSSWYNQPTAQFYHVITDNRWPYWIYGSQQDAGAVMTVSRSDYGEITFRDWLPPGNGESGYIAPDPRDSTIVYGGGPYGGLVRFDRTTGQVQDIRPWPRGAFGQSMPERKYRFTWTSPLVFDPIDKRTLYFGSQILLRTTDGGLHWQEASPDLTGAEPAGQRASGAPTIADASAKGWGVIYSIAPSPVREGLVWVGTDNGKIQITLDRGLHWRDVTPSGLEPWSKISTIDASRLDTGTAYAAIDRHRLDDIGPFIYRTHDYGRTWTRADQGIPQGAYVRVVRADPERRGLLYAGTELGVYVSFDDGDRWQSLQLNLPMSPVHDLAVHDADLIAATHGRSFWVLDDVTPLRQMTAAVAQAPFHLFRPASAIRLRQSENHDTPLPPEFPHGDDGPTGAVIDYWLASASSGAVTLDVLDERGAVVRHFASGQPTDTVRALNPSSPPPFIDLWLPHLDTLTAHAGDNRFIWDLRLPRPSALTYGFSSDVTPEEGAEAEPDGALVVPGTYRIRLTVNGQSQTEPLDVKLDPREHVSPAALETQYTLAVQASSGMSDATALERMVHGVQDSLSARQSNAPAAARDAMVTLGHALDSLHVAETSEGFAQLETAIEGADRMPTAPMQAVYTELRSELTAEHRRWTDVLRPEVVRVNSQLQSSGLAPLPVTGGSQ